MAEKDLKPPSSKTGIDVTVGVIILVLALALLGAYLQRLLDLYQGFLEWFYSVNWSKINFILSLVFSLFIVVLFVFIIWVLKRYSHLFERVHVPITKPAPVHVVAPQTEVSENWEEIRRLANSSTPSDWNMAVLRADALLDDALMHLGYEGTTMAERLKIVDPTKLKSVERIWSAHRLRNMIAHDPLEQHTKETIIHALRSYEQALNELGLLGEKEMSTETR